jgi:integrase
MPLKEAFDDYVRLKRRSKDGKALKPRTVADMLASLDTAFSDWQSKPLPAITREMVERRYAKLCEASVARASIAMRYLRAVYNFTAERKVDAEGKPLLADNPVRVLKSQWRAVKARKGAMDAQQLAKWFPAVMALGEVPERAPGEGKTKPRLRHGTQFRDLFLFYALTGARRSEALGLKVEDVDLVEDNLTFRDPKNRLDHVLPLTPRLKVMLEGCKGTYVFESPHDGSRLSNLRIAQQRVRDAAGVTFTPHALRRLAATAMERAAVPAYTIKGVMNHLSGGQDITGDYVQVDRGMKLAAMLKIDAFVTGGVSVT